MLPTLLMLLTSAQTPWDRLFKAAGTTAEAIQIPSTKWRGGGTYALPIFNACWDDWRKVEPTTLTWAKQFRTADAEQALDIAGQALNEHNATVKTERLSLRAAILACGGSADGLDKALDAVPKEVSRATAQILSVIPAADRLRAQAMEKIKDLGTAEKLAPEALEFAKSYDPGPHGLALMEKFDLSPMLQAGKLIARSVNHSVSHHLNNKPFKFEWKTPLGRIELSGGEKNKHDLSGALLVIETGDKAEFTGHGPVSGESVVIASGKENTFKDCGLAVFGISQLYAYGGQNNYQDSDGGIGGAAFGVSTVVDGGQSRFQCHDLGEGAAVNGVGILINLGSKNTYLCRSNSQGFGGPKGFGVLVDTHGESQFTADDIKIDNPSPQTAQHNVSMSQGAGFGRRDDPGAGHSMAGGVGLLVNGGDHNHYSCGVFGQGVAYWYSIGALVNFGSGNTYKGVWYVQGSAAHYSIACQLCLGGGDTFEATMAQSQGQGHDYSIGLLRSFKGGNDYKGAGGAFGSGRWNGLGLFATVGKNKFEAGGESFGYAADHRPSESCYGFFASPGPTVIKSPAKEVEPGKQWIFQDEPKPKVIGAGFAGK